jgi:hypothetical protein
MLVGFQRSGAGFWVQFPGTEPVTHARVAPRGAPQLRQWRFQSPPRQRSLAALGLRGQNTTPVAPQIHISFSSHRFSSYEAWNLLRVKEITFRDPVYGIVQYVFCRRWGRVRPRIVPALSDTVVFQRRPLVGGVLCLPLRGALRSQKAHVASRFDTPTPSPRCLASRPYPILRLSMDTRRIGFRSRKAYGISFVSPPSRISRQTAQNHFLPWPV